MTETSTTYGVPRLPPKPSQRVHRIELLSPEGRAVVEKGLLERVPLRAIVEELKAATGETATAASISRWNRAKFRAVLERKAAAGDIAAALAKSGFLLAAESSDPEQLQSILTAQIYERLPELKDVDVRRLLMAQRDQKKLELAKRSVEVDEKRVDLLERELAMKERRESRVVEALRKAESDARAGGGTLTADKLKEIREVILGITDEEPVRG